MYSNQQIENNMISFRQGPVYKKNIELSDPAYFDIWRKKPWVLYKRA